MILTIPTHASRADTLDEELMRLHHAVRDTQEAHQRAHFRVQMAKVLNDLGEWDKALAQLQTADSEAPQTPYVQRGYGMALFREGHIAKGLRTYDAGRWQLPSFEKFNRAYPFQPWQGHTLSGKRILVWAEQGVGDQVMHARVLHDLLERGADVTVECDPRLIPLFKRIFPTIDFHTQTVPLSPALLAVPFDFQTSMFSAWRWANNPGLERPSIGVDPSVRDHFTARWHSHPSKTNSSPCLNIGISWFSKATATGTRRSIDLNLLSALPAMAEGRVRFHNLQYGQNDSAALARDFGAPLWNDSATDPLKNLDHQCAQIAALDLVITIDNATAHLAGALGVPCWVLMPKGSEFRWGKSEQTTQLYKSLRLFRSTDSDSWGTTILNVADALNERLSGL